MGSPSGSPRVLMGVKEYARYRGCSPAAVRKAIDSGRIKKRKDGKIHREQADAAWPPTLREELPERVEDLADVELPGASAKTNAAATRAAPPGASDDTGVMKDLNTARTAKESMLAHLRRIELRLKMGELIERADVDREQFAIARKTRDSMLAIADRLHEQIAAESDPRAVYDLLQTEIRQALHALADELEAVA